MTTTYNGRDIVARAAVAWSQYCGGGLFETLGARRGYRRAYRVEAAGLPECEPGGWLDGPKPRPVPYVAVYSGTVTRMPLMAWRQCREAA